MLIFDQYQSLRLKINYAHVLGLKINRNSFFESKAHAESCVLSLIFIRGCVELNTFDTRLSHYCIKRPRDTRNS